MFGLDDLLLGAIAAPVIGGLFGSAGQASANSANAEINATNNTFNAEQAVLQRTFSAEQAQKQMDFQEDMANTSWQRGVSDMKSAGLSPMLAYMKGGSVAPPGAMGTSSAASAASPIGMGNVAAAGASSAASAATVANTLADTVNKEATKKLIDAQTSATTNSAQLSVKHMDLVDANIAKIGQEIPKLHEERLNVIEQRNVLSSTWRMLQQQEESLRQQGLTSAESRQVMAATIDKLVTETSLNKLDLDAAGLMNNMGRAAGQAKPLLDLLMGTIRAMRSR